MPPASAGDAGEIHARTQNHFLVLACAQNEKLPIRPVRHQILLALCLYVLDIAFWWSASLHHGRGTSLHSLCVFVTAPLGTLASQTFLSLRSYCAMLATSREE